MDFEDFSGDIWICFLELCSPVGGSWVDRSTKGDSLGSRVGFLMICGFGEPVGSRFLAVCLLFLGLRLSIFSVSSEVCLLVALGRKMITGSVVGCAENIVNALVFVRFHFFTYLVN